MDELYHISPGVEVLTLDTAFAAAPALVIKGSRYLQISGISKLVLSCLQESPRAAKEISAYLRRCGGEDCTEGRLHSVLTSLEQAEVIELCDNGAAQKLAAKAKTKRGYFLFRIPLISEKFLRPITSQVSTLFETSVMVRLLSFMLLMQALLWPILRHHFGSIAAFAGSDYVILLTGNYLGLLLHELGHASACVRNGVRHGPIGFGLYLIFPTFYTDVTPAWKLSRGQRMVVDAGGIYMSLIAATVTTLLFWGTGRSVYAFLTAIYDVTVWISLWPFVRMDGYWLMSDLLGIPNLMSANIELTKWLWLGVTRRACARPRVLSIEPKRLRTIYLVYYFLFLVSIVWMAERLALWYFPALARHLPVMADALFRELRTSGLSFRAAKQVLGIVLALTPAIGIWFYVSPIVKGIAWRTKGFLLRLLNVNKSSYPA